MRHPRVTTISNILSRERAVIFHRWRRIHSVRMPQARCNCLAGANTSWVRSFKYWNNAPPRRCRHLAILIGLVYAAPSVECLTRIWYCRVCARQEKHLPLMSGQSRSKTNCLRWAGCWETIFRVVARLNALWCLERENSYLDAPVSPLAPPPPATLAEGSSLISPSDVVSSCVTHRSSWCSREGDFLLRPIVPITHNGCLCDWN